MSTILTLHDPQTAREYYANGVWRGDTLYSLLLGHARTRPQAYALRDSTRRITWSQLAQWVDALASEMQAAGLKRGQRVSVWLPNRIEAAVVFLACSRNGYVCNPSLHQNYTVNEITQLLDRIQTAVLFAQAGYGSDADRADVFAAAKALPAMKRVYRMLPAGAQSAQDEYAQFPALGSKPGALPEPDLNPDKIVYLAFTSGTTGMPKGAMQTHRLSARRLLRKRQRRKNLRLRNLLLPAKLLFRQYHWAALRAHLA